MSDKNTRRYLNSEINRQGGPRPIQGEIGTVGDDEDNAHTNCGGGGAALCPAPHRQAGG